MCNTCISRCMPRWQQNPEAGPSPHGDERRGHCDQSQQEAVPGLYVWQHRQSCSPEPAHLPTNACKKTVTTQLLCVCMIRSVGISQSSMHMRNRGPAAHDDMQHPEKRTAEGRGAPVMIATASGLGCPSGSRATSAQSAAPYKAHRLAAQYACFRPLLKGNSRLSTCT